MCLSEEGVFLTCIRFPRPPSRFKKHVRVSLWTALTLFQFYVVSTFPHVSVSKTAPAPKIRDLRAKFLSRSNARTWPLVAVLWTSTCVFWAFDLHFR